MFTLPQWIARLTKGYIKFTGKEPDNLAKLKINMEAAQRVKDQSKVVDIKRGSFSFPKTPQEKIDWLVKNVDSSAKQTIPPRETLEAMLKDGREDLIDHFYKMHTKELGKPKINIDTSGLKHPELVKKMIDKPGLKEFKAKEDVYEGMIDPKSNVGKKLAFVRQQLKLRMERENREAAERIRKKKAEESKIDPNDFALGGIAKFIQKFKSKAKDKKAGDKIYGVGGEEIDVANLKKSLGLDEATDKKSMVDLEKKLQMIIGKDRTKHNMGGIAGELHLNPGGRARFDKGGMNRRGFLKLMGGLAALPVVGKFFKLAKPAAKAVEAVKLAPATGMPEWFPSLVNKVIKQGDDMTKQFATKEREIVHSTKIGNDEMVSVYQDLDTGNVRMEYDTPYSMGETPIQLDYKAGEIIQEGPKKGTKTKPNFSAVEAEPRVVNWDGDIEWDGENIVNAIGDLNTDTSKLKQFATGKKPNMKEIATKIKKDKYINDLNKDTMNQVDYIETKFGPGPEPDDFAKGGLAGVLRL